MSVSVFRVVEENYNEEMPFTWLLSFSNLEASINTSMITIDQDWNIHLEEDEKGLRPLESNNPGEKSSSDRSEKNLDENYA